MKVVHVSWDPLSAAPYRLAAVQRTCGVDARLISENRAYEGRRYPYDVLMEGDPEPIRQLLAEADLVHYHNWWRKESCSSAIPGRGSWCAPSRR